MEHTHLPVILLNEGNLDFIFDIFDRDNYQVGLGTNPGVENTIMREESKRDMQRWAAGKNPAIAYVEIDPIRKRYIPLVKWFEDTAEMKKFISENINNVYSEPINYWSDEYKEERRRLNEEHEQTLIKKG